MPRLDDLPAILEKSNQLARIDRYLSSLEEFSSFFVSAQHLRRPVSAPETGAQEHAFRSQENKVYADFEATRAREKIRQEQRLCQTYMRQYDALVQLVSYI